MSKRFGRNQKRRMRKELSAMGERLRLAEHSGRLNAQAVQDTVDILGRYFAGLPPEVLGADSECPPDEWRVPGFSEVGFFRDAPLGSAEMVIHTLQILKGTKMEKDLKGCMHLEFRYAGRAVGYALSQQAIHLTPRECLIRNVSKSMAEHLVHELRGAA